MRFVLLLMLIGISSLKAQWLTIDQIPSTNFVYSLYATDEKLYAGTDSVLYHIAKYNGDWEASELPSDLVSSINAIVEFKGKLIVGTMNDRIFVSYDSAKTWANESEGITGLGSVQISDLIVRGDSIYASTMGATVFVANLNNTPLTWKAFNSGLTNGTIENLNIHNGTIYAGGEPNGYLFYNKYGSSIWESEKFGVFAGEVLIMHDFEKNDSMSFAISTYGIHTKDVNGVWKRENLSYGFIGLGKFVTIKNELYAYLTKPNGTKWLKWNANDKKWVEQFTEISKPATYASVYFNDYLLVGTGSGLWYLEDIYLKNDEPTASPAEFLLEQNYPNPFNPGTTVTVSVNNEQSATLSVYNIVGELVTILYNGTLTTGSHSFVFDASALPSGIYFARLTGELGTQVKKMMYIK